MERKLGALARLAERLLLLAARLALVDESQWG